MTKVIAKDFSTELARIAARYEATPRQLEKASARALKKTFRHLADRVSREVARRSGVGMKVMRHRIRSKVLNSGSGASLWMGLEPIELNELGSVRQSKAGVKVKGFSFDGGFYQSVFTDEPKAYVRTTRARALGIPLVHFSKQKKRLSNQHDPGRFPVNLLGVNVEEDAVSVIERFLPGLGAVFQKRLSEELNFALKS